MLEGTLGGVELSRFPRASTRSSVRSRAASAAASRSRSFSSTGPSCCCSTSRRTTSTSRASAGWRRHLAARRGALVVVTHDRWFLDTVCSRTWEIDAATCAVRRRLCGVGAGARRARAVAAVTEGRRRNLLRKELAWLRRGPPARTTKPRFRIDAANALIADEPVVRDRAELLRFATARLGQSVLDVEGVGVTLGDRAAPPPPHLAARTWRPGRCRRGERIGQDDPAAFARAATSSRPRESCGAARRCASGSLSQDLEELAGGERVLEALESVRTRIALGDGRELTASQLCERFGFAGNRQWTFVADLSGGERRRLQLMRLMMAEPNVLLLDEPTNDLDIDTLTALEDLLDGWPGTLVVVSHDRYFVERVCDDVYAITDDGGLAHMPGGIEQYLELRARQLEERIAPPQPREVVAPKGGASARGAQGDRATRARARAARRAPGRAARAAGRARDELRARGRARRRAARADGGARRASRTPGSPLRSCWRPENARRPGARGSAPGLRVPLCHQEKWVVRGRC